MLQESHNAYDRFVKAHPFVHLLIVGILTVFAIGAMAIMAFFTAMNGGWHPGSGSSSSLLVVSEALLPLNILLLMLGVIAIVLKARIGDALFFGAMLLLLFQVLAWGFFLNG